MGSVRADLTEKATRRQKFESSKGGSHEKMGAERIKFRTKRVTCSKNSQKAEWPRTREGGRGGQGASHGPDDTGLIGWWQGLGLLF